MTATNECSTLMLYLLLHRNENVKNLILARADLELLVSFEKEFFLLTNMLTIFL